MDTLTPRAYIISSLLCNEIPEKDGDFYRLTIGDKLDPSLGNDPAIVRDWIRYGRHAFESRCMLWQLRQLGVTNVTVSYGGGGDEGHIDAIELEPFIDTTQLVCETPFGSVLVDTYHKDGCKLSDVIEDVLWRFTERVAGYGWYNNEGGRGDILVNVVKGTAVVCHTSFTVEDCEQSTPIELPDSLGLGAFLAKHPAGLAYEFIAEIEDGDVCYTLLNASADVEHIPDEEIEPIRNALVTYMAKVFTEHEAFNDCEDGSRVTLTLTLESAARGILSGCWTIDSEEPEEREAFSLETLEEVVDEDDEEY
jgi:hypothetical protein